MLLEGKVAGVGIGVSEPGVIDGDPEIVRGVAGVGWRYLRGVGGDWEGREFFGLAAVAEDHGGSLSLGERMARLDPVPFQETELFECGWPVGPIHNSVKGLTMLTPTVIQAYNIGKRKV